MHHCCDLQTLPGDGLPLQSVLRQQWKRGQSSLSTGRGKPDALTLSAPITACCAARAVTHRKVPPLVTQEHMLPMPQFPLHRPCALYTNLTPSTCSAIEEYSFSQLACVSTVGSEDFLDGVIESVQAVLCTLWLLYRHSWLRILVFVFGLKLL